jgi:hypothetical protein
MLAAEASETTETVMDDAVVDEVNRDACVTVQIHRRRRYRGGWISVVSESTAADTLPPMKVDELPTFTDARHVFTSGRVGRGPRCAVASICAYSVVRARSAASPEAPEEPIRADPSASSGSDTVAIAHTDNWLVAQMARRFLRACYNGHPDHYDI